MEQQSEHQDQRALQGAGDAGQLRFRIRQRAGTEPHHVGQREHRVRVDGVDVVEAVLRARAQPRDLGKERSHHSQLVQRHQRAAVAPFADQQVPEVDMRFLVRGQLRPDPLQLLDEKVARVAVDRQSQGFGDGIEADQIRRTAGEDVPVGHRDAAVPDLEGGVDRLRARDALERAPGRVLDGATVDQGVGGAGDLLQRDVRLPHQLLDAQLAAGLVGIAERLREAALVVERQPIVAASGGVVQLVAQPPEQIAGRARRGHLAVGQEAPLAGLSKPGELVPDASDPERRLQVAQASLALLQVRLEQPHRTAIAASALVELLQLVADEFLDAPLLQLGDGGALEPLEQLRVARDQAAVEQRRADGVVLARELDGLVQRARRVPGFETGVPERAMQVLRDEVRAGASRLPLAGQEREEIDERDLEIPFRLDGSGVGGAGRLRDDRLEQLGDHLVGQRGDGAHDLLPAGPAAMPREDLVAAFGQTRLCPRHRRVVRHVLQHNKAAERSSFRSTARHAKLLFWSRRPRRWISLWWRARRRVAPGRFGGGRIPTFRFPWLWILRGSRSRIVFRHWRRTQGARARRRRESTKSFTPRAIASAVPSWKRALLRRASSAGLEMNPVSTRIDGIRVPSRT